MAEFVGEDKRCIAEGEQVFVNQTSQLLSVTTGISFNRDGDYFVSVHEGRIIVTEKPVKRGKWIKYGEFCYKCSVCRKMITNIDYLRGDHRFCYGCGARMDGKEDEDKI